MGCTCWPANMPTPKVDTKNVFFLSKIRQLAIQLLSTGQQADISIKVEIFSPVVGQGILRLSIFFKIINIL